jgi:hypothetical protein
MRIQLTRNVVIRGEHHVAGTIMELPPPLAVQLLDMQKAIPAPEGMETAEAPEPERSTPRKRKPRDD